MKKKRGAARLALTALAAALCLVWSGLGWGAPRAAAAESAAGQPYNIALLIDKSGSMNATDPARLAVSAAGMFVNSLYTESLMDQAAGTGGARSRVGVISFSADTETETIPVELTSEAEVSFVAGKIDAVTYDKVNTGATDLGRAGMAGTEMPKDAQDSVGKKKNNDDTNK